MAVIRGVCPVLETPFTENGEIDEASFLRLIDHLYDTGVRQLMFAGYASEFYKLRDAERARLRSVLLNRAAQLPGLKVVISVADHATLVAIDSAREAVAAGAAAINLLPPYLLGPDASDVREHIRAVASAVAPAPVIVQYAPAQTGGALEASVLAALAAEVPSIAQVKVEAVPPGRFITALSAQTPRLDAAVGYGGVQLIDALRRGVAAVQPGCSFAELYLDVWALWSEGSMAQAEELHRRMLPYLSYWMQSVELIVTAEKRISCLRGLIDTEYCRSPRRRLDTEEIALIDRFLDEFQDRLPRVDRT